MTINWAGVAYIILTYFIGAIPTGYIIARQVKGIDIREHGSGNVGATNVKRVVGNKAGLTTLVLDFFKGYIPVLAAQILFLPSADAYHLIPVFSGLMAVVGHSKSVYIGFSGGKSVITSLGVMLALQPIPSLILAAIAITIMKVTRYVSLGSILGAALLPVAFWWAGAPLSQLLLTTFMGIYVIYLHRGNIHRLLHHQENRI